MSRALHAGRDRVAPCRGFCVARGAAGGCAVRLMPAGGRSCGPAPSAGETGDGAAPRLCVGQPPRCSEAPAALARATAAAAGPVCLATVLMSARMTPQTSADSAGLGARSAVFGRGDMSAAVRARAALPIGGARGLRETRAVDKARRLDIGFVPSGF